MSSSSASGGAMGIATTIEKLATLQNMVKRDPEAYADEFKMQHQHFLAELEIFKMNPSSTADAFIALVHFLSHVAGCYRKDMAEFPLQLVTLLTEHADLLQAGVRHALVQALILMRNRGLIQAVPLIKLFFSLFRVKDKYLRQLLFQHIVHDIRSINKDRRDDVANRAIQNFLYGMLSTADEVAASPIAARKSLDVLIELYRRHVWMDARTVNVIASALTIGNGASGASSAAAGGASAGVSKSGASTGRSNKLLFTALKFFLGVGSGTGGGGGDDDDVGDSDLDSDADSEGEGKYADVNLDPKAVRQVLSRHSHSKHTKKRQRHTARMLEGMKKNASKEASKATTAFPAIQLLNDPQGLAEKCFAVLRSGGERFEVKLLLMNFISRLIGQHKLLLLPFYSFVQRYLTAHQSHVTQVLAFLVQSCHDLVPPDEILPVIRTICNSFIADRCGPELIQVGLNAVREVIAHCPVVLEEEGMKDLIGDLILYRKYKNRGVVASARSVLNLVRDIYPALLRRRDWGKDVATSTMKASARPTAYGLQTVATGIEGADLLAIALARKAQKRAAAAAASAEFAAAVGGAGSAEDADDEHDDDEEDDEGMMRFGDDSDDDEDSDGEEESMGRSSGKGSKRKAGSVASSSMGTLATVAPIVDAAAIAALHDDDEWKPVELAKRREARKAGKAIPKPEAKKSGVMAKAALAAALAGKRRGEGAEEEDDDSSDGLSDLLEDSDEEHGHGHGHGHAHAHEHGDGCGCGEDHEDGEGKGSGSDEEGDEDDEDEESEDGDEDEEEAPRKGKGSGSGSAVAGMKRKRPAASADDDEDEEEDEEDDSDEDDEDDEDDDDHHSQSTGGRGSHRGSVASSRMSHKAAQVAALAASVAPLLSNPSSSSSSSVPSASSFQLEAQRFLTPKDFARIRKMRAKLQAMGIDDRQAAGKALLQRMLAHVSAGGPMPSIPGITSDSDDSEEEEEEGEEGSEDESTGRKGSASGPSAKRRRVDATDGEGEDKPKRKRRGGRRLGYEDGTALSDEEEDEDGDRNQLAMPGVSFMPSVATVDPHMLESDITRKKRRAAERLASVIDEKTAKYEGKKPGGGLTNREKQRFKNYLMLRKSSAVQQKMKRSLSAAKKDVKSKLHSSATMDRRKKQRRRRA